MKIALINACRYLGGAELRHLEAAIELQKRGFQVWLIARPGPVADRGQEAGIPVLRVPMRNDVDILSFVQLCNFFVQERPAAAIFNDLRDLRLAGSAAWLAGVPVRIHRKGSLQIKPGWLNRFLYGRVLTHVYAVSRAVGQATLEFGFPSNRLLLFYNAVDPERFRSAAGGPLRQVWQIPAGTPLIGCVSRLSSRKGQDDLLRAAALLREQGLIFRLAFIGAGRLEGELKELCRSLGLEDRVIFTGHRDDIPAVLAALDVVVQPSVSEPGPTSVLEAMAAGKPIIATASGGLPELIADGERGLLVPVHDPEALARALARLLRDPELGTRLAAAARDWVTRHHDLSRLMDQLAETLQDLAAEAGKSSSPSRLARVDALAREGKSEAAGEILDQVLFHRPGDSWARINRYYLTEVQKVRAHPLPHPEAKIKEIHGRGPENPAVSVLMCTYNRPELIRESITSVLNQQFRNWELLVINDGGSREVEATLAQFSDPRIRYLYAEHGGFSSALNVGQHSARGRYLAYLDDDDVYYPDHLARLVGYLEEHAECKLVYADAYRTRQEKGPDGQWHVVERTLAYSQDFDPAAFYHQTYIPTNCAVHRRECVTEVGGFNEAIQLAVDWEYYLRLSRRYRFHHLARVTGEYRVRDDQAQMTTRPDSPRNYYRNLILFLHDLSPLPSARRGGSGQGSAKKLFDELSRLLDLETNLVREFELRKLFEEPYYSLFYTLGKKLLRAGRRDLAREAFRSARRLAWWEPKTQLACWRNR